MGPQNRNYGLQWSQAPTYILSWNHHDQCKCLVKKWGSFLSSGMYSRVSVVEFRETEYMRGTYLANLSIDYEDDRLRNYSL